MNKYKILVSLIFFLSLCCNTYDHIKVNYIYNHEKFNIIGSWSMYYDAPNTIYHFKRNNIVIGESWSYGKPPKFYNGTYVYDGCCKLVAKFENNVTNIFEVVIANGETTLKLNDFIFDKKMLYKGEK